LQGNDPLVEDVVIAADTADDNAISFCSRRYAVFMPEGLYAGGEGNRQTFSDLCQHLQLHIP
jgi:hypothetical protein